MSQAPQKHRHAVVREETRTAGNRLQINDQMGDGISTLPISPDPTGGCRPVQPVSCFIRQRRSAAVLVALGISMFYTIEPALLAIRGQRSAHSFATGPLIAEPVNEARQIMGELDEG